MEGKNTRDQKVYQTLFYVSLHLQDQCKEVQKGTENGKSGQSGHSLVSVARISAVSLSPEPREDPLKPSVRKPPLKGNSHTHFFLISQDECATFREYLRNDELLCTRENDPVRGADGQLYKNKCYMCRTVL